MYKSKRRRLTIEKRGTRVTLEEEITIKMQRKSFVIGKDARFNVNFSPDEAASGNALMKGFFDSVVGAFGNVQFNGTVNFGSSVRRIQQKGDDSNNKRPIKVSNSKKRSLREMEGKEEDENEEPEEPGESNEEEDNDQKSAGLNELEEIEDLGFGDERLDTLSPVKFTPARQILKARRVLDNQESKIKIVPDAQKKDVEIKNSRRNSEDLFQSQVTIPETQ